MASNNQSGRAGALPSQVVMGGDSCSKVVSSNPGTVYWMDIFSHTFLMQNF